ncbi:MAG: hypothetical protein II183_01005 [Elusimicrobiaceae bacterium]|nr:hypothetical protein [Elusimicrobiaceae bacterium]MBQ3933757.1 hypothetical protein [Elusimicrobiaceae bacterium]
MKIEEKRDITLRKIKFKKVPVEDLTQVEIDEIVSHLEEEMEKLFDDDERNVSSLQLFGYLLLDYAMRLYKIEHFEKTQQKAEEKRLDETLKRLENFLKNP